MSISQELISKIWYIHSENALKTLGKNRVVEIHPQSWKAVHYLLSSVKNKRESFKMIMEFNAMIILYHTPWIYTYT